MTAAGRLHLMSVEEYLAAELDAEVRHEYLGGHVYAMAGAKMVHNQVATAFTTILSNELSGTPCQALNSDMKVCVRLQSHTRFYYPDGTVVCGDNDPEATYQDQPIVIAEVLSDSTRRTDEGEKCDAYLSIPSLRVYLLIETDLPRVVARRRNPDGPFESEVYNGLDAVVPLPEIEAELPLAKLYERVDFSKAAD